MERKFSCAFITHPLGVKEQSGLHMELSWHLKTQDASCPNFARDPSAGGLETGTHDAPQSRVGELRKLVLTLVKGGKIIH